MKNILLLRFILIFTFIYLISVFLAAQGDNRNLLQLKLNVNYFPEAPSKIYRYTPLYYPDISYKRFLKSNQSFIEFEFDNVYIAYYYLPKPSDIGKTLERNHFLFEAKYGRYLTLTPNVTFYVKGGLVYRTGYEYRISSVGRVGTFIEVGSKTYYYNDLGITASVELIYKIVNRWYLTFDAGGERFLIRKVTTKEQLRAGLGIGFAF